MSHDANGHRYDGVVPVHDPNHATAHQLRFVPRRRRVLDVGCATGTLARVLQDEGCTVLGVEIDSASAAIARDRGVEVLERDITVPGAVERVLEHAGGERFDVIVCGDVLEHLPDPAAALHSLRRLLDPSGAVVASIPNVAHGSIRLDLLRGRFAYTETGLLDRTHVQLFTRATIHELFADCGFEIEREARAYNDVFGTEDRVQVGEFPPEIEQWVLADRESWVYQYVVLARPRWDADDLATAAHPEASTRPDVRILPLGPLPAGAASGYRLSLPRRVAVAIDGPVEGPDALAERLDALADDELVLVVPADAVPAPGWVQALWDAAQDAERPVGVGVATADGRVVHAGAVGGRPFGVGDTWASAPLFTADRPDARLLPPVLGSARDLRGSWPVPGRFVGSHAAVTRDPATPPPATGDRASLRDAIGRCVLFLADVPPSLLPATIQPQVAATFQALLRTGVTPVYRWSEQGLWHGRLGQAPFERQGVVLFGGDPGIDLPDGVTPDRLLPTDAALVGALRPEAVIALSRVTDAAAAAATRQGIPCLLTQPDTASGSGGAVVPASSPAFTAHVLEAVSTAAGTHDRHAVRRIGAVPAREARTGVTSVVIPVWNLWNLTDACLTALERHTSRPLEVIVVDNGSTDETPDRLPERGVRVIRNEENRGFAAACNQGIAAATGEFVCVLNNDTEVTDGWLDELLVALSVPGAGLAGPRSNRISGLQVVPDAPAAASGIEAHRWAATWSRPRLGRSWPATRLVGFCLLGRRETFVRVGGFDESFGIGNFEDDDLCDRVRATGLELRVADGAVVLHHGGATFRALGVDYAASLRSGARLRGERQRAAPVPLMAVVLSDGDPTAARTSAASALTVTDAVVVLERAGAAATELALGDLPAGLVEVVGVDWTDGTLASQAVERLPARSLLVIGAGEEVSVEDWGTARVELDALGGLPAEVTCPAGSEVRLHPPAAEAVAAVGGRAEHRVESVRIVSARPGVPAAPEPRVHPDAPRQPDAAAPAVLSPGTTPSPDSRPVCSIVIPLFNKAEYTERCLDRLAANTPDGTYELVLVDNGSTDETSGLLDRLPGDVRIVRNAENLGFARASNQGAAAATAPYLLLLNNDTEPQRGWLEPLLAVLDEQPDVGAVGARLLFPDGTLQHAGVVVLEDRRNGRPVVHGFHRFYRQPGDHPPANAAADLQVVTAAAMLVRRDAFEAVGGFDEGYWNGNEDIDLCFKLREAGWRIVYEPRSCLVHHESVSGPERFRRVDENVELLTSRWLGKVASDFVVTGDGTARPHPLASGPPPAV